jgi:glyoxylase-like metal-dependent hydrolase (beta-lactamase superfamily II)
MAIRRYLLGPMDNNTYLIMDEATKEAALVDPSFDSEAILPDIRANGYMLRYILNTHAHFDHILGNAYFAAETGAPIALHRADLDLLHRLPEQGRMFSIPVTPSPEPTIFLEDDTTLMLGETPIQVLFTPGHAPGHVTFLIHDTALVGDCLFQGSIGRTDLSGGSLSTLMHSIRTRLLSLPDETQVLPGHGELTTIGIERESNPYLQGRGSRG